MSGRKSKPPRRGLISEYLYFFRTYKMWWLLPVIVTVVGLGGLVILSGTKGGLMIYALF